jgi:hypothetical protein
MVFLGRNVDAGAPKRNPPVVGGAVLEKVREGGHLLCESPVVLESEHGEGTDDNDQSPDMNPDVSMASAGPAIVYGSSRILSSIRSDGTPGLVLESHRCTTL